MISLWMMYLALVGFISFYIGRAYGYREGADMSIRQMNKVAREEIQKSLSDTIGRIEDQLYEDR